MSTFSAFRSVTVEFLYPNLRCIGGRILPKSGSEPIRLPRLFHRHIHFSHSRRAWVKTAESVKRTETPQEKRDREKKLREIGLRDRAIPYDLVCVRTSGGLSDVRRLLDVIAEAKNLNIQGDTSEGRILKQYCVQLVGHEPRPIVEIIDSKAKYQKEKRTQEKTKNNAAQQVRKEVQLTWTSSEADVETKLEKIEEDLKKGFKIDLAIMPKKGVRPPGRENMQQRADELTTHFSEFAKEWKDRDYTWSTVVIYFQGTSSAAAGAAEGDKKQKKLLQKEQRRQKLEERVRKKQELEVKSKNDFRDDTLSSS